MKIGVRFWLILIGILLFCCKKEEISEPGINRLYAAPQGGTIKTGNIKLSFPEGSVLEKTEIFVQNLDSLSNIKNADSIYFFRYLIAIWPEDMEFKRPVTITISDDKYFYKTFDEDNYQVYFPEDELKLYNIDLENNKIYCLNNTKIDIGDIAFSVHADISHTGYYAIGISKKNIDYKGGYFIATISSNDPEIKDTTFRFDSQSGNYSWCYLTNKMLSNTITSNLQISQKNFNTVFSLETNARPDTGEHKVIWKDENYILKYMQMQGHIGYSVEISGSALEEGIVDYTKFGGLGEIVEGKLISKGTTLSLLGSHIVNVNVHFIVRRMYYE